MGAEGYSEGSDENNRDIDNEQDESIQVNKSFNAYLLYFVR